MMGSFQQASSFKQDSGFYKDGLGSTTPFFRVQSCNLLFWNKKYGSKFCVMLQKHYACRA